MWAARKVAPKHFRIPRICSCALIAGRAGTQIPISRAIVGYEVASFEGLEYETANFLFHTKLKMHWNRHSAMSRGFASLSKDGEEDEDEADSDVEDEGEGEGESEIEEAHDCVPVGLNDLENHTKDDDPDLSVPNKMPLYQVLVTSEYKDIEKAIEAWLRKGNIITRKEVIIAFRSLRRRRLYRRALKVSQWLISKKPFEYDDGCHSFHLEFLFKVGGLTKAEKYFKQVPSKMKRIAVYRTVLLNYSNRRLLKKANQIFERMQNSGFEMGIFDYNCILSAYQCSERSAVAEVLKAMESKGIEPNTLTYRFLILMKSADGDIDGAEEIVNTMKSAGREVNPDILGVMGTRYISAGMAEKAEKVISELEAFSGYSRRYIIRKTIFLYSLLKKENDVKRLWEDLESLGKLRTRDYTLGVMSWGKVGDIEKAEEIFERMLASALCVRAPHYNALLNVYADHDLLIKGDDLVKRMRGNGIEMDRLIIDTLVKLYLNCNEMEKLESVLSECFDKKPKLHFTSGLRILKRFAERGDVKNAERIFDATKTGILEKLPLYETLLQAYDKANVPAYGFKERMLGDKTHPNQKIKELLKKLNTHKKAPLKL